MSIDYVGSKLTKGIVVGVLCGLSAFFGIDIVQTFENKTEISQNSERFIENKEKVMALEWKVNNLESPIVDNSGPSGARLCTCVAEENTKTPRVKLCPAVCDTQDAIEQCEGINKGYQCG